MRKNNEKTTETTDASVIDKNLKHHGLIQADAKFMDERDTITDAANPIEFDGFGTLLTPMP